MTEVTTNLDVPRRALVIGAHPDDVEFGCGATFAKWAAAGCAVHHLICTDGSKACVISSGIEDVPAVAIM